MSWTKKDGQEKGKQRENCVFNASRVQKSSPTANSVGRTAGRTSALHGILPNGSSLLYQPYKTCFRETRNQHLLTAHCTKQPPLCQMGVVALVLRMRKLPQRGSRTCLRPLRLPVAVRLTHLTNSIIQDCFLPRRTSLACHGFETYMTVFPTLC